MNPIRERIARDLGGSGAFLRCDRGEALYATNLPALSEDWRSAAEDWTRDGLRVERRGPLLLVSPGPEWGQAFAAWALARTQPGELTRLFLTRRGRPVCPEETACWFEGVKRLELNDPGGYEKRLRQSAAVALRRRCGGLLACGGLCLDMMAAIRAFPDDKKPFSST